MQKLIIVQMALAKAKQTVKTVNAGKVLRRCKGKAFASTEDRFNCIFGICCYHYAHKCSGCPVKQAWSE
jgi:hypothetical protein